MAGLPPTHTEMFLRVEHYLTHESAVAVLACYLVWNPGAARISSRARLLSVLRDQLSHYGALGNEESGRDQDVTDEHRSHAEAIVSAFLPAL